MKKWKGELKSGTNAGAGQGVEVRMGGVSSALRKFLTRCAVEIEHIPFIEAEAATRSVQPAYWLPTSVGDMKDIPE